MNAKQHVCAWSLAALVGFGSVGCANKSAKAAKRTTAAPQLTLTEQAGGEVAVTPAVTPSTTPATQPTTVIPVTVVQADAVIQREWPEQVFLRANGDVIAGPTYWDSINSAFKRSDEVNILLEPAEFLANVALLPVRALITPPDASIVYSPVGPTGYEKTSQTLVKK